MTQASKPDPRCVPVVITLPRGQRSGWLEPWRDLIVWKELAAHDDLDEFGEPEGWYWAHAHTSQVDWRPLA